MGIVLADVLEAFGQTMSDQLWEYHTELEEESFPGLVGIGIHVEGPGGCEK